MKKNNKFKRVLIVTQSFFDWSTEETFVNRFQKEHNCELITVTINSITNEVKFFFRKHE